MEHFQPDFHKNKPAGLQVKYAAAMICGAVSAAEGIPMEIAAPTTLVATVSIHSLQKWRANRRNPNITSL